MSRLRRTQQSIRLIAPSVFSLTRNPNEAIQFFNDLDSAYENRSSDKIIFIDLESVIEMTSEVIVVLISRIKEIRSTNNMTHGNIPRNSDAQEMLISSGFYDYVTTRMSIRTSTYGTIEKCADNIVDSEKAAHLIDKVSELIGMSPEQEDGHQTTAMECMTNTREHASGHQPSQQGNKNWWFSVYCDQEKNLAQFSFVDLGIGIFVSLEKHQIQWLAHIKAKIGSARRSDVLEELLSDNTDGNRVVTKKRTSTRQDHRGHELPNIARRNRDQQTRRLIIISNNVFADVEHSEYRILEQEFSGTVICWEHRKL